MTAERTADFAIDYFAAVPAELRARAQWVGFRLVDTGEKHDDGTPVLDKPPVNPHTNQLAKINDPTTWGSFDEAVAAVKRYKLSGVMFALTDADPYAFTDLDHVIDPVSGAIQPWAQAVVERVNTYTERSVSGTGIHLIARAVLPPGGRKRKIEMYDSGRFVTFTGNHMDATPTTIERRPAEIVAIHGEFFPAAPIAPRPPRSTDRLDDQQLLERAVNARNGAKVRDLHAGNWTEYGYGSQSEADLAFCSEIAFWTDDPDQIYRIVCASGLYDDKWDRDDYRQMTIGKALAGQPVRTIPAETHRNGHLGGTNSSAVTPWLDSDGTPCTEQLAIITRERDQARAENRELRRLIAQTQEVARNNEYRLSLYMRVQELRGISDAARDLALAFTRKAEEAINNRRSVEETKENGTFDEKTASKKICMRDDGSFLYLRCWQAEDIGVKTTKTAKNAADELTRAGFIETFTDGKGADERCYVRVLPLPPVVDTETGELLPGIEQPAPIAALERFACVARTIEKPEKLDSAETGHKHCPEHPNAPTAMICTACRRLLGKADYRHQEGICSACANQVNGAVANANESQHSAGTNYLSNANHGEQLPEQETGGSVDTVLVLADCIDQMHTDEDNSWLGSGSGAASGPPPRHGVQHRTQWKL
jgi:hypothetical protein